VLHTSRFFILFSKEKVHGLTDLKKTKEEGFPMPLQTKINIRCQKVTVRTEITLNLCIIVPAVSRINDLPWDGNK